MTGTAVCQKQIKNSTSVGNSAADSTKKASTIRCQLLEITLNKLALLGYCYFDAYLTKLDKFIRTAVNFVSTHFFGKRNIGIFHQKELIESCTELWYQALVPKLYQRYQDHSRQYNSHIYILSSTDKIVLRHFKRQSKKLWIRKIFLMRPQRILSSYCLFFKNSCSFLLKLYVQTYRGYFIFLVIFKCIRNLYFALYYWNNFLLALNQKCSSNIFLFPEKFV